jgi:NhaC family Na+:H+ antiporter
MTCIIASLMSLMTGTSWGTVSTVGVALMGVSAGLGVPVAYTAGAITVGAIFGDKLSPLSDTTVLSAAVADVDIVTHIKYLLYTTLPCLVISLLLYGVLGANYVSGGIAGEDYDVMMKTLSGVFNVNPIMMIPPVIVLALIAMKKPTVPTFFTGIVAAMLLAAIFQEASIKDIMNAVGSGYTKSTEVKLVDTIVLRGGLRSMLGTIVLVLSAGVFGAPLKASGAIEIIIEKVESVVRNEKQMMLAVGALHIILFLIVVSYYVSFIIIGNMTKDLFDKYKLNRANLSRTLEDTGTAIAPLIPWGLSGAFYSSTLGIDVTEFVLYAPITYLSCVFGAFYILTGFKIARVSGDEA